MMRYMNEVEIIIASLVFLFAMLSVPWGIDRQRKKSFQKLFRELGLPPETIDEI